MQDIELGAKILKLAVAFDRLSMKGLSDEDAIAQLRDRHQEFGRELIDALAGIEPETARMELRKLAVSELTTGMILQQEIRTCAKRVLIAAAGQEVTHALLIKLHHLSRWGSIDKEITALVPV
ncbi:MAG: hypothetical protein ABSD75_34190 [Terriglobales bacterium]